MRGQQEFILVLLTHILYQIISIRTADYLHTIYCILRIFTKWLTSLGTNFNITTLEIWRDTWQTREVIKMEWMLRNDMEGLVWDSTPRAAPKGCRYRAPGAITSPGTAGPGCSLTIILTLLPSAAVSFWWWQQESWRLPIPPIPNHSRTGTTHMGLRWPRQK